MSLFLSTYLSPLLFAMLGLPLVIQDLRESSVSLILLIGSYALWALATFVGGQSVSRLVVAAIVLLVGALVLSLLPGRLGEADVLFISGMASIFPYWSFMIALALSCVAGLAAFLWLSRRGRDEMLSLPIPLLPSLYWGGLTVILGGLKI